MLPLFPIGGPMADSKWDKADALMQSQRRTELRPVATPATPLAPIDTQLAEIRQKKHT